MAETRHPNPSIMHSVLLATFPTQTHYWGKGKKFQNKPGVSNLKAYWGSWQCKCDIMIQMNLFTKQIQTQRLTVLMITRWEGERGRDS